MDMHTISALELPKVLEYLAGFAVSESGRQACLALRPRGDPGEIRQQAALFEQGRLWAQRRMRSRALRCPGRFAALCAAPFLRP